MTIKQQGGVFGRHPTFSSAEIDGPLNVDGLTTLNVGADGPIIDLQKNGSSVGAIGASGTEAYINSASTLRFRVANNVKTSLNSVGAYYPSTTNVSDLGLNGLRWRDLYLTGNVILASGSGIDFSATSGTGTSELFDDYEEGAVASPLYVGGVQVTSGYSTNAVSYTKVGDTVMMNFFVDYTSPAGTGPSGDVTIGLPFTPTNSAIAGMSLYMSVSAPSYVGAYISVASGVGTAAVTEANINTIYSLAQGERIIFRAATAYRAS